MIVKRGQKQKQHRVDSEAGERRGVADAPHTTKHRTAMPTVWGNSPTFLSFSKRGCCVGDPRFTGLQTNFCLYIQGFSEGFRQNYDNLEQQSGSNSKYRF